MRRFVDFANVTVTVLIGAYLVLLTLFATDGLKLMPEGLVDSWGPRFLFFLIGAALVGVNLNVLVKEWKTGGLRSNLRITTEQGTTEFSVPAMEMLVLRDLKAEPDILDPVVTLRPRGEGKPMRCEVELKLRRQEDVIKRIDGIKKKVRDIIDRLIPGGLTVEVLVEVRDIVNGKSASPAAPGETVLPTKEFNGPVYTDGGGSEGV
ncbi:MAG: alkaline shock response membrane anchor protein AmaP [Planctomycetes bacterium]|nr:alkaline shock response membrane anchor protein AmaP [Planctomycetota bacterium]